MNIEVKMRSGEIRKFPHQGRAGGSYTKTIRYEPGFVVITDEWHTEIAIPTADIAEVKTDSNYR